MRLVALGVMVAITGCFSPSTTTCSDGTICPDGKVCAPAGGACVAPDQLSACEDRADGDRCDLTSVGHGVCRNGVCLVEGCGDGVVAAGEVCDDGNTMSGDGCRADCQKIEACGDGIVDPQEACDDGNVNPADGCDRCKLTAWSASVIVGGSSISPTQMQLAFPHKVALDPLGNLFVTDEGNHRVLRVDAASHAVTLVAGNGVGGSGGDGGPAVAAELQNPEAIAVDGAGNVFIGDSNKIRRVDALTGTIATFAGTGLMDQSGGEGDGGLATLAHLRTFDVAVDGLGNVYVAEGVSARVRKIDTNGIISTFAGGGTDTVDGPDATQLMLRNPTALAIDANNNVYIGGQGRVRMVTPTGASSTIAGDDTMDSTGDGGPATAARVGNVQDLALDGAGNLYIVDLGGWNKIRRVDATTHNISTIAGTDAGGYSGDGGPATAATLSFPLGLAIDDAGTLYIADSGNSVIRSVDTSGVIHTAIGTGTSGGGVTGDPLATQQLAAAEGVAIDAQGRVYASAGDRVLRFDGNSVTTYAGGGSGGGVLATDAQLSSPSGLALDGAGNLYIADKYAAAILKVDAATNEISRIAGNGSSFYSGDGGLATSAGLGMPTGIAVDASGTNIYVALPNNNTVRRITGGVISRVAGQPGAPSGSFGGDNGPATNALLNFPSSVSVDATGNLFIADSGNHRVRKITGTTITTFAGNGTVGDDGDGGAATSAALRSPNGVFAAPSGGVYIADSGNGRIRRVDSTSTITTVAGDTPIWGGDHGPAVDAALGVVVQIAIDSAGDIAIGDGSSPTNGHVRWIDHTTGVITTLAGKVLPVGIGPRSIARMLDPGQIVVAPAFTLVSGGREGIVQAVRPTVVDMVIGRYLQERATGNLARYRNSNYGPIGGIAMSGNTIYVAAKNHVDAVTIVDPANADTWTMQLLAGDSSDTAGFADGAAAQFRGVGGLWLDNQTLYVADTGNHVIRAIDLATKMTSTVAGKPHTLGYAGENVDPKQALLFRPRAIIVCGGDLFIADTGNNRVRRIAAGKITTVLGDGVAGSSGDGAPSTHFPVDAPAGLACDTNGNVYVTSTTTVRLLAADASGHVDGTGAVATIYGQPPRTTFPSSVTRCLSGIATVDASTVRLADSCTGMLIDLVRQEQP